MGRDLVTNLKFKKIMGQFDPIAFGQMINEAYIAGRNLDRYAKKNTFSPSTVGYGHGMCPRYWFIAFNGTDFEDNFDAIAIANMENGKQAHERIQNLLIDNSLAKELEREILCDDPPIRGFADMIVDWYGTEIIGELKTVRDEVFAQRQASMAPSTSHLIQLLLYMWVEKNDEGFLMYENKNNNEILVMPIYMNERHKALIEKTIDWMRVVYANYKENILPERTFTKSTSTCKYCPVRKECWSGEHGDLRIEKLDLPK
jgi:CRISPR/Cas system-associated exonuclease Cas4 (RecB family)